MIINRICTNKTPILLVGLLRPPSLQSFLSSPLQEIGVAFAGAKLVYRYRSQQGYIDFTKDYYQLLGVNEKATFQQIKTQFYLLAKEHHPDKEKGDEAYFKEINEAYNVLSQPKLKDQYDANRISIHGGQTAQQKPLTYKPYSQMSPVQWSYVRRGTIHQERTDYTNFQKVHSTQADIELRFKEKAQWNQAFKRITPDQLKEEHEFREKLVKKYKEDVAARRREKEEVLQMKIRAIGDGVERVLGKAARNVFQKMIRK